MKKITKILAGFLLLLGCSIFSLPLLSNVNTTIASRESESLCRTLSLEQSDVMDALQNLKAFLATDHHLDFEILTGGAFNPPALVSRWDSSNKVPLGVVKLEQEALQAAMRMKTLDTMRNQGCDLLPRTLQSPKGEYLANLGGRWYSCMEYLIAEEKPFISFEEMLRLTSKFHTYSKTCCLTESHFRRTLDYFLEVCSAISDPNPQLMQWDPSIFNTIAWENSVQCTQYLTSPLFRKIYDSLPMQLIHGDIAPHNVIFSSGKPFLIDFESMRMDIRLRDFATFSAEYFLDQFLDLSEKDQLIPYIQENYGELEAIEKDYLPFIVLLERCAALAWRLQVLAQAMSTQDAQKMQELHLHILITLDQINKICRLPAIQSQIFNVEMEE